jgi:hypothetical protein
MEILKVLLGAILILKCFSSIKGQKAKCISKLEVSVSGCSYEKLLVSIQQKIDNPDELYSKVENCPHSAADEILLHLPAGSTEESVKTIIYNACKEAQMDYTKKNKIPWANVTKKGAKFDKEYYDGNGDWNEEHQSNHPHDPIIPGEPSNVLNRDAEIVDDIFETSAQRYPFAWPGESPTSISNFANCELQSVMCCWVSDRQANDNNGDCATPYDENCIDANPADNTDLCAVDMSRSLNDSSHVSDGFAIFPVNQEGPVHCHGFAWGEDVTEANYRYRANNLFFVSMSDHLHDRGYVRNVQGAPMCSCVENMPIVTRADCTEINAKEFYKFTFNNLAAVATIDYVDIAFNACQASVDNNLERFYQRLLEEGRVSKEQYDKFKQTVVGMSRCPFAVSEILLNNGYTYDPLVSEDFREEKGFCVRGDGIDQNAGVIKLDQVDYGPSIDKLKECLDMCIAFSEKAYVTGCESIWDQGNRGCYVHTSSVAKGNNVDMHQCWIVKKEYYDYENENVYVNNAYDGN